MPDIIRPFAEGDYTALTDVGNLAYPDAPTSEAELRFYDRERAPHCRTRRWVAERDGRLVVNEQLGFVKKPAWLHMVKTFRPEG